MNTCCEKDYIVVHDFPPTLAPNIVPSYCPAQQRSVPLIKNYINSCIYVWTKDSSSFWMFPTCLSPDNVLTGYFWEYECNCWKSMSIKSEDIDGCY